MTLIKNQLHHNCKNRLPAKQHIAHLDNTHCKSICGKNSGGMLIEVVLALFIFVSSSAYLLTSGIKTQVLWYATLDSQDYQTQQLNIRRLAYTHDPVDQNWSDIAVFGIPTTAP